MLNDGAEDGTSTEIPDEEKALGNKARVVDSRIDIVAYEYEAELQPIVYVKANVVGNTDGKSWTTALTDLQAAADLAGIYTHNNENRNGYVFVHNNVTNTLLHLRLPRTKVYGGMNDELTTFTETDTEEKTKKIVTDLLNKRKGLLEATAHSTLSEVTLTASDALADGFVIGTADSSTDDAPVATVRQGTLTTSVVEGNVAGSTTGESTTEAGLLYNTLVKGNVDGVKAVNVTATGTIAEPSGNITEPNENANNRMNAAADNLYVTDSYWSYQLNETSEDIDKGTDAKTEACIQKVGHNRDIAGNKRIHNTVDNGCFETWTSPNGNSNRFTHKENMSWNLFGSPYLCAMNYKDMEYGRVLYGLDGSAYRTVNTETEGQSEGYIPAGDAVFTQTATLKDAESFNVAQPTTNNLKNGTPYQGSKALTISLTRAATGEADNAAAADLLQLKAVPTTEARNDFDLSADGVKWMAAGEPQLYALRSGNRYSLLSAVDIEGSLSIGVSIPASGIYTLALPDGCDTYGYDAVVLEDAVTGQTADLLEGSYGFNAPSAGDLGHRFTLRFQRPTDDVESSIRVWSDVRGEVSIAGIASGDLLLFYSASGTLLRQHATTSDQVTLTGFETGIVLVKVVRKGEKAVICKVRVK